MHKFMYLLWPDGDTTIDTLRRALPEAVSILRQSGARNIRLTLTDSDVADASRLAIHYLKPAPVAILGFKHTDIRPPISITELFRNITDQVAGYRVTEREPLPNITYQASPGQRTPGMNQVVLLRKPDSLDREEWLRRWLDEHTPIAIRTQATFGYRQNIVVERLGADAPAIDAIVEENFPGAAMTSPHAFYNAGSDDQALRKNQKEMFASVVRFVDLEKLDCLPMSEYNF